MKTAKKQTKLEKHLEELEEMSSGNSKDAITFAGRGLDLLKSMIGLSKSSGEADEEEVDEDPEDPAETKEDHDAPDENLNKSANGGELEDADEDPEDPAQAGDDAKGGSIITNKGKKIPKSSSAAVKKSMAEYELEEEMMFLKHYEEEYGDVVEASEAVAALAKSVNVIGKAGMQSNALMKSLQEQNIVLAKAVGELLKSNASIAAELEELKKQPVSNPSPGFFVAPMAKSDGSKTSAKTMLRKSDIQDAITDAMNAGHEEAGVLLKKLGVLHSNEDLKHFVENILPDDIRENI